jgi:hypothetical protein
MMPSVVDKVEARSSVELVDSCNCTQCCPRNCCFPWSVRKIDHRKPEHEESRVEITATAIKVHTSSEPSLTESGAWEIEIDGKKQPLKEVEK